MKSPRILAAFISAFVLVLLVFYHSRIRKELEIRDVDSTIAQAGQLVVLHRALSKDDRNYKQISLVRVLAREAQEKVRMKNELIRKCLPNEKLPLLHQLEEDLLDIVGEE